MSGAERARSLLAKTSNPNSAAKISSSRSAPNLPRHMFLLDGRPLHRTWDFAIPENRFVVKVFDHSIRVDNGLRRPEDRGRYGLAPIIPAPYRRPKKHSHKELHSTSFNTNTANPVSLQSSFGTRYSDHERRVVKRQRSCAVAGGGSEKTSEMSQQHAELMIDMALRPPRGVLLKPGVSKTSEREPGISKNMDGSKEQDSLRRDLLYMAEGPRLRPMELQS